MLAGNAGYLRVWIEPSANEALLRKDGLESNATDIGYDREEDYRYRHTLRLEKKDCRKR